jgi:hypothetical protein
MGLDHHFLGLVASGKSVGLTEGEARLSAACCRCLRKRESRWALRVVFGSAR